MIISIFIIPYNHIVINNAKNIIYVWLFYLSFAQKCSLLVVHHMAIFCIYTFQIGVRT